MSTIDNCKQSRKIIAPLLILVIILICTLLIFLNEMFEKRNAEQMEKQEIIAFLPDHKAIEIIANELDYYFMVLGADEKYRVTLAVGDSEITYVYAEIILKNREGGIYLGYVGQEGGVLFYEERNREVQRLKRIFERDYGIILETVFFNQRRIKVDNESEVEIMQKEFENDLRDQIDKFLSEFYR